MNVRWMFILTLLAAALAGCGANADVNPEDVVWTTKQVTGVDGVVRTPFMGALNEPPAVSATLRIPRQEEPIVPGRDLFPFDDRDDFVGFLDRAAVAPPPPSPFFMFWPMPMPLPAPTPTPSPSPAPAPSPTPTPSTASNSSTTMIQEAGVDESDKVKHDGLHFYIVKDKALRIVRARPSGAMEQVAIVELPGQGISLYMWEGKAAVLTQTMIYEFSGDDAPQPDRIPYGNLRLSVARAGVTLVDVSDPSRPEVTGQRFIDGCLAATRRIGDRLYLVLERPSSLPWIRGRRTDGQILFPGLYHTVSGQGRELLGFDTIYHPVVAEGSDLITVASLDLTNPRGPVHALGIMDKVDVTYMSAEALYLGRGVREQVSPSTVVDKVRFHKIVFRNDHPFYVGTGDVVGTILDSYSMGEHEGHLRVATQTGTFWAPSTRVSILRATQGYLIEVGRIADIAPGEQLDGARFIDDRGFLVTSVRRYDPFFTLDLSDPTDPRIVGQVSLPGVSGHMIPISENAVVAVGRDMSRNPKITLFDITDYANPSVVEEISIHRTDGNYWWADSEALSDPKAFQWYGTRNLLAVPVSSRGYDYNTYMPTRFDELVVVHVNEGVGLQRIGSIDTNGCSSWTRAIFLDDDVYAVRKGFVRTMEACPGYLRNLYELLLD